MGWGTAFFDFDNDGWLDLDLASTGISPIYGKAGMHFQYPDMLYYNNGDGTFTLLEQDLFMDETYSTVGFSTADYNKDGLVDFVVTHWNDKHRLYKNSDINDNNWIAIQLEGSRDVPRDALGTRVYIETSDGRTLMQEVKSGSSLGAGNETTLHFGLVETTIERIVVYWLGGKQNEYTEISVNQYCLMTVDESILGL